MHLRWITTCTDPERDGKLLGIKFTLASTDYTGEDIPDSDKYALEPIGQMTGNCQELRLLGPLDRIRAATELWFGDRQGIVGIRYYRGPRAKTYGKFDSGYTQWMFSE